MSFGELNFYSLKTKQYMCLRAHICALLILLAFAGKLNAQLSAHSLEQKMVEQPKNIVIMLTESTCMPCLMQLKQIEKSKSLSKRLDQDFYFLEVDINNPDTIAFNRQKYGNPKPDDRFAVNDFAYTFGRNEYDNLLTPTWLFFDKTYQLILKFHGLLKLSDIEKILDAIESIDVETITYRLK